MTFRRRSLMSFSAVLALQAIAAWYFTYGPGVAGAIASNPSRQANVVDWALYYVTWPTSRIPVWWSLPEIPQWMEFPVYFIVQCAIWSIVLIALIEVGRAPVSLARAAKERAIAAQRQP